MATLTLPNTTLEGRYVATPPTPECILLWLLAWLLLMEAPGQQVGPGTPEGVQHGAPAPGQASGGSISMGSSLSLEQ